MERPKEERLKEFYRRLGQAPAAGSRKEARERLAAILNQVEDEMTTIPYNPANWMSDGRMYPPLDDNVRNVVGHPKVKRYRSRNHNTFIGSNGSIEIQDIDGMVEFSKPGADGKGVWES